jgi:hypothetical protein
MALMALAIGACGGRSAPLPDITDSLAGAVVRAALADDDAREPAAGPQPLVLDSLSFPRLGVAAGGGALSRDELQRQVGRAFELVDPRDVLVCESRQPCHTANNAVYLTIWEAERSGDRIEMVVNRVSNVQGLYLATVSVVHRLVLLSEGGAWRLIERERLPS